MQNLRYFIIVIMVALQAISSKAQDPIFHNYTPQQYKAQTQNWDVEELPGGRVAFANNAGMVLYDGDQWSVYPIGNYTVVRSLRYSARRSKMYAGATGEFGYYSVDNETFRIKYHSMSDQLPKRDRHFGEIWKILIFNEGKNNEQIVFQSKTHIFIYGCNGYMRTVRADSRIETIGAYNGRLIVGTRKYIGEVRGGKIVPLRGGTFSHEMVVRYLGPYLGKLLIATQQNGLFVYDDKQIAPYAPELHDELVKNEIFSISVRGTKMCIGTVRNGLIAKDFTTGSTFYLNNSQGLQNNTILSLLINEHECVWMGLDNGLSFAVPNIAFRNVVSPRCNIGTGYTALVVGQTLYLGTNQGLYTRQLPFSQQMTATQPPMVNGVSSQVWHLSQVGNTILCGTDRGLYRITGNSATKIDGIDGTWSVLQLRKHPGYLIVCDYLGMALMRMNGDTPQLVRRLKVPVDVSGNIFEDSDGTLWMSIWQQGIYHMQLSADMTAVKVLALYNKNNGLVVNEGNVLCDVGGHIYISSVDGFYLYNRQTRKLVYDKRMSRLFNTYGASLRLVSTPSGDIWAQKGNYLAIAHRGYNGYTVDSMSYRAILENQQVMLGDISIFSESQSLINTTDGFYLVANRMRNNMKDYPLYLRRITSTNNGDSILYQSLAYRKAPEEIEIPHSLNSIRVEFALPEYRSAGAVTYQCRLENYDPNWSYTSSSKEYTRLSRGKYVLHVRAYDRMSGKTQEMSVVLKVLPAWYETILARIFYFIGVCLIVYLLISWLKKRADRELVQERIQNEQRMKEQQVRLEAERSKRRAQSAEMQAEQLQNELKHKSSELATSTMTLIHHNDILQQLDEDMHSLSEAVRRDERKPQITSQIQQIRQSLQQYLNEETDWAKFEDNFNVVYDDFMVKLTTKYPVLKKSDRKLCAYLKMGLSSKEMASLLNMSVRSVETARYRLRKKLELEAGDNLVDFIQRFK